MFPAALCLSQDEQRESVLIFSVKCRGDTSSWHGTPGLGNLLCRWDPSHSREYLHHQYPPCAQPPTVDLGLACFTSLPLLPVSMCPLLYILSCRCFVRCFSRLTVLQSRCNFNVIMRHGRHSIYLFCHLGPS